MAFTKDLCSKRLSYTIFFYSDSKPNPTDENEESVNTESNTKSNTSNYSSISDLLLWAIFANRKELAEICWLRGTDHLCKFFLKVFRFVF